MGFASHLATASPGTNILEVNLGGAGRGRSWRAWCSAALTSLSAMKLSSPDGCDLACSDRTIHDAAEVILVIPSCTNGVSGLSLLPLSHGNAAKPEVLRKP